MTIGPDPMTQIDSMSVRRGTSGGAPATNRSRIGQASCGPGPASGWNCTERARSSGKSKPLDRAVVERDVRRLGALRRLDGEAVVLARDEDAARPRSSTGWFAPRWPKGSLYVRCPAARPRSWWPRQMPRMGTRAERVAHDLRLCLQRLRVAGAVRQDDAVERRQLVGRGRVRADGDGGAGAGRGGA